MRALDRIRYWVLDVDGTMTDGSIYYDEHGNECKKFNVKDAAGLFAAHALNMKVIVLTGRECKAVLRRMTELEVDFICQGQKDKAKFLEEFMTEHAIAREEIAYIGDDLNDLSAMQLAGFVACPADACAEVKEIADHISARKGGQGAVRDIIEFVLRKRGEWETAAAKAYHFSAVQKLPPVCKSTIISELEDKIENGYKIILYDFENKDMLKLLCDAAEIRNLSDLEIWHQKVDMELTLSHRRIITKDEMSEILKLYHLYEFSDKLTVLSDRLTYPGMLNYIRQGLMTESEVVETFVR